MSDLVTGRICLAISIKAEDELSVPAAFCSYADVAAVTKGAKQSPGRGVRAFLRVIVWCSLTSHKPFCDSLLPVS